MIKKTIIPTLVLSFLFSCQTSKTKAETYFKCGRKNHLNQEYISAIQNYTNAINLNSKHTNAYFFRGNARIGISDSNNALQGIFKTKEIAFIEEDNALHYVTLGREYFRKNDIDNSEKYFKKAIHLDIVYAIAPFLAGYEGYNQNELDGAI